MKQEDGNDFAQHMHAIDCQPIPLGGGRGHVNRAQEFPGQGEPVEADGVSVAVAKDVLSDWLGIP